MLGRGKLTRPEAASLPNTQSVAHRVCLEEAVCAVKNLTLSTKISSFALDFWAIILNPWNAMPDRNVVICLGTVGHTRWSNSVILNGGQPFLSGG